VGTRIRGVNRGRERIGEERGSINASRQEGAKRSCTADNKEGKKKRIGKGKRERSGEKMGKRKEK